MSFNFGQFPGYKKSSSVIIDEVEIGNVCTTPAGLIHVEIQNKYATKEVIDKVISQEKPVTLAINYVTKKSYLILKKQGFTLRSELVRWYALVGTKDEPWKFIDKKRAKKIRSNIRKAKNNVVIKREPFTIEQFKKWLTIYEKEVVNRIGGIRIFYCDIFLLGKKISDLEIISCYKKSDNTYLGGCVVNPWGGFGDIEKEKKYTSFLLSAFSAEARKYALGYWLDELVMGIAEENKNKVYGHGADLNFWGTDISPGLLSRKSAPGMMPFPEGKIQAFKVIDKKRALSVHGDYYFMELIDDTIIDHYFDAIKNDKHFSFSNIIKEPWKFPIEVEQATKKWRLHHAGKDDCKIQIPKGIEILEEGE